MAVAWWSIVSSLLLLACVAVGRAEATQGTGSTDRASETDE